jgi:Phage replication protein CRI
LATGNIQPGPFWEPHGRLDSNGRAGKYVFNSDKFKATFYGGYNRPLLVVEASLPRIVHGANEFLIHPDELEDGISSLLDALQQVCPNLVVSREKSWRVSQVDFCHQWKVPSPSLYIQRISDMQNKRKGQKKQTWSGVDSNFESLSIGAPHGSYGLRIYDKGSEVAYRARKDKTISTNRVENAKGLLRFEVISKRQMLESLIGKARTLDDFCEKAESVSKRILTTKWENLFLGWEEGYATNQLLLERATAVLSDSALVAYGLILAYGTAEYRRVFSPSTAKWYRDIGEIKKHGLPLSSIGEHGLSMLTISAKSEFQSQVLVA